MTLGQNIASLRSRKNLSQGDLADALDVSRQSVSKWETDASVPELEKLLRLAELFGVTLDELVKGEAAKAKQESAAPQEWAAPAREEGRANRIAGVVFLVLGMLVTLVLALYGGGILGLLFGMPFFLCGLLCFVLRGRRTWIWCTWGLYLCVDFYLRYGTGLNWRVVFQTFRWTPEMNYVRLLVGWGQFVVLLLLIALTLSSYRNYVPKRLRWKRIGLGWAALLALRVIPAWYERSMWEQHGIEAYIQMLGQAGWGFFDNLLDYLRFGIFCCLAVQTLGAWRLKKREKQTE